MRLFQDYTYKWKGRAEEAKKHIEGKITIAIDELRTEATKLKFSSTKKTVPRGEQYKPDLPLPKDLEPRKRRISFVKEKEEIEAVADYLFGELDEDPSAVGERCFDLILKEARK